MELREFCPGARCVFDRDPAIRITDVPPSETTRWRAVVRVLRSPIDSLSCALLPSSCALCGSPLPRLSAIPICDACWTEFPLQNGAVCACCGDALNAPAGTLAAPLCRACRMAPPAFVRAVSYGPYNGRMREAIHALKYDGLHPAARGLGKLLAQAIAQLAGEAPARMLVVPVPLHRSKYSRRGFNQSRSLAVEALRFLRKSYPQWHLKLAPSSLIRLRATESQAGLTPRQRRLNVRGAFSVADPALVKQQNILVVDDILTTGATARAAALALTRAGAASVWVATLARAQRATGFGRGLEYLEETQSPEAAMQTESLGSDSASMREQPSF